MPAPAVSPNWDRDDEQLVWRALSNPVRRTILDLLRRGPRTTGQLDEALPQLSRFAVMQHLGVLTEAGLVVVRRKGRYRINHLNPAPLRLWYERWVSPMADAAAAEVVALRREAEKSKGDESMTTTADQIRTVRIETELRFRTSRQRVFEALTGDSREWFPFTFGEDRVRSIVVEQRVGGAHYEDWGDGAGYLYGQVTVFDPPRRFATRGRVMAGTILDTEYEIEEDGDACVLRMSKVAVGPMTEEEADSIRAYGDIAQFEVSLREIVEGAG